MRGFGLSIDDYGTGFSSLRPPTRVPFTELKVDQGFVSSCADDAACRAIAESSVDMARRQRYGTRLFHRQADGRTAFPPVLREAVRD
jgi:EAL domain-containing protein (putative c-di-GMP-specific phosphodiesterase class I)